MKTYRVVFANDSGSRASDALAGSIGGSCRNSVQRFDGENDLAFIECPEEQAEYLEGIMDEDGNILCYRERP